MPILNEIKNSFQNKLNEFLHRLLLGRAPIIYISIPLGGEYAHIQKLCSVYH